MARTHPRTGYVSAGLALAALVWLGGCRPLGIDPVEQSLKPTVAVMKFECRAGFPMKWQIGTGMADILVDRLVATGKFRVIERPEIDAILREQSFQRSGVTRTQQRAKPGRLKNVQYLIKGTVTDFGHASSAGGFLGLDRLHVFHSATQAVMGLTLYVVDVESGEILCSESLQESVNASDTRVQAVYKGVSFGGQVFFTKPLGRATAKVIDRAIDRISDTIASRPWVPKIAQVRAGGLVVLNGGHNRRVGTGQRFAVLESGEPIIDPDTGDLLGEHRGRQVGTVVVQNVQWRYSEAKIVEGAAKDFQVGQACRAAGRSPKP